MNIYEIYQVREDDERTFRDFAYASLESLVRDGKTRAAEGGGPYMLPREAWRLVYVYVTEMEPSLDWLFLLFNRAEGKGSVPPMPESFHGHSMSVSDIIKTPDGKLWFCDSLGWKQVQWEETDCHTSDTVTGSQ